ncbi:4868_t:CDS:2, partial [Dentiscutata heterogama]
SNGDNFSEGKYTVVGFKMDFQSGAQLYSFIFLTKSGVMVVSSSPRVDPTGHCTTGTSVDQSNRESYGVYHMAQKLA